MPLASAIAKLRKLLGQDAVLDRPENLMLYEYDASIEMNVPGCIVFPRTTEDVSAIVRIANAEGVPLTPRGAGTGLSGGSIARDGGIVIVFSRMNRILEIDLENMRAVVEPGVINLELSAAVDKAHLFFAPDP